MKTFAAIDVGSYELAMKIFEISSKNGIREIDSIRHRIDLGTDTFTTGKIANERVDELCRVLRDYAAIMKNYRVDAYKAYGTSAVRETENTLIVLDQIAQRTGIRIEVLSNSEQRFLDYKSIASLGDAFGRTIEKGTAIVDIGGGSLQISLFDKDTLVTTQNMKLGVLRLQDQIGRLNLRNGQMERILEEIVNAQLMVFKKLYLEKRRIEHVIVVDDYVSAVVGKQVKGLESSIIKAEAMDSFLSRMRERSQQEVARVLGMPEENVPLLYLSGMLISHIVRAMNARLIWTPGVTLCDGMAYEYGEKNKLLKEAHDFEQDIIACAKNISRRYMGSRNRGETLEKIALTIYDSMKKVHGLGKRERLLLRIAAIMHDCGKYISLINPGECAYHIILSTEIIGLSHMEREIVANVVKYNHMEFAYYEVLGQYSTIDKEAYLTIAKLTAILKIATGLDRSHKEKFRNIGTALKGEELIIWAEADVDITLERGLISERAAFFEEVYSVRPVIVQKKKA